MKNKLFLMISVIMVCSLCACGQQETGTMTNTGNSTEQVVVNEYSSEQTTVKDTKEDNTEQTETKEQNELQTGSSSYEAFRGVLDEINTEVEE